MKILFVLRHVGHFRFFDKVIRQLCADGHNVQALLDVNHKPGSTPKSSARNLLACEAEVNGFNWEWSLDRHGFWRTPMFAVRELINYSSYLWPGRKSSRKLSKRGENYLPRAMRKLVQNRAVKTLLLNSRVQRALRSVERLFRRSAISCVGCATGDRISWWPPPSLMNRSEEIDYVKAAAALEIPTAVAITSWDHLTTKGVFQLIPDLTLVWNRVQVREAIELHGVPEQKVVFTGAPVFEDWFGLRPTIDRQTFSRQVGLDPEKPYVLYLCSSKSIAPAEATYVEEVAHGLRLYPATRHLNILVRPHPLNADIWRDYNGEMFAVWPREGDIPDIPPARQDFFHALYFSIGVIGINTSGLIEAAIADRPCATILAERYRDTQREISHFQHLLAADYLEVASDIPAVCEILTGILRGEDAKQDKRRRFVQEFVRTLGSEPTGQPDYGQCHRNSGKTAHS